MYGGGGGGRGGGGVGGGRAHANNDVDDDASSVARSVASSLGVMVTVRADGMRHLIDRKLLRSVNSYLTGFDLDFTKTIDWRDLLCRLRPLLHLKDAPSAHLDFAFDVFTSDCRDGAERELPLDAACRLPALFVALEEDEELVAHLARQSWRPTVRAEARP